MNGKLMKMELDGNISDLKTNVIYNYIKLQTYSTLIE